MNDSDTDNLLNALENETNSCIMNLTTRKIKEHKNNALQQLPLKKDALKVLHKKLKHYRYVRGMHDLQFGYYIRWIPLKNPTKICLKVINLAEGSRLQLIITIIKRSMRLKFLGHVNIT